MAPRSRPVCSKPAPRVPLRTRRRGRRTRRRSRCRRSSRRRSSSSSSHRRPPHRPGGCRCFPTHLGCRHTWPTHMAWATGRRAMAPLATTCSTPPAADPHSLSRRAAAALTALFEDHLVYTEVALWSAEGCPVHCVLCLVCVVAVIIEHPCLRFPFCCAKSCWLEEFL